jgi:hypothetical protein
MMEACPKKSQEDLTNEEQRLVSDLAKDAIKGIKGAYEEYLATLTPGTEEYKSTADFIAFGAYLLANPPTKSTESKKEDQEQEFDDEDPCVTEA